MKLILTLFFFCYYFLLFGQTEPYPDFSTLSMDAIDISQGSYDPDAEQIGSLMVNNTEYESLLLNQDFQFRSALSESGEYFMIPLNLFSGLEKNSFVNKIRFTHINFVCLKSLIVNRSFTVDKSMSVEAILKYISLIMPDTSIIFTRFAESIPSENRISVHFLIDFLKPVYPSGEYPMIFDFNKKYYGLLEEPIL